MKKNLLFGAILCIGLLAIINSCVKDTFTEQDAYNEQRKNALQQDSIAKSNMELEAQLAQEQALLLDSLKKVGGVINYSVGVVVASESSWLPTSFMDGYKGEKGLDGATVTIAQHGMVYTVTTDASGIASFKDLRIGTANVNIRKTGYTTVDYVVDLPPLTLEEYVDIYDGLAEYSSETWTEHVVDLVRHAATMIPVFSLTDNLSTITGIATVETDLTNNSPEVAAGINIKGVIDVEDEEFFGTYLSYGYGPAKVTKSPGIDFYGAIRQIAFGSTISTATTGADGSFTLQVPSTPQGLPILITFDEFAADQTLLLPTLGGIPVWGPQTVRTMFGYNVGTPATALSYIPGLGTTSDSTLVQSAYVEFSEPAGSVAAQPTVAAKAHAVLTSSGIVSVRITEPGDGYTQAPVAIIKLGSGFNSVQAEGTAVISGGKVTDVTITNPGSGYLAAETVGVKFVEKIAKKAKYEPEFTFSVVEINPVSGGSGYAETPPVVTIVGSGTGATAHAVMEAYLDKITVTAPGSGYTQQPIVVLSDNFGATVTAAATMTLENPILSIAYDGTNTTLWPASPVPTVTIGSTATPPASLGAGATATATLATTGGVLYAGSIVHGAGYATVPEVTLTGGGGFGATAHAVMDAGPGNTVDTVIIDTPGQGYTSTPTIVFTGGGGTTAAGATAVLGYRVATISMTAAGVNYTATTTTVSLDNGVATVSYTADCDIKYNMGVLSISGSGGNFSGVPTVTITPSNGLGTGATATASVLWGINDIVLDSLGSGYKMDNDNNVVVKIDPPATPNGVQATADARLGNGILAAVRPVDFGEGYTAPPNVNMLTDGDVAVPSKGALPIKQAKMTATVVDGNVTAITITDPGEGYNYDDYVSGAYYIDISTFNKAANADAKANAESGKIAYIVVDKTGEGYSVVPTIEFANTENLGNANGFGSGATATAVVVDGKVTAINVTDAGSGYYVVPTVNVLVNSAVMKAMARCVVNADGRITSVDFTNPTGWSYLTKGFGYDTIPSVTFFPSVPGKGAGATGVAVVKDGKVDNVIITNQGSGYVGKNRATSLESWITGSWRLNATAGRSYVKDLYFGTGRRTVD